MHEFLKLVDGIVADVCELVACTADAQSVTRNNYTNMRTTQSARISMRQLFKKEMWSFELAHPVHNSVL